MPRGYYLRKPEPVETRFWDRVDKTPGHGPKGECWIWTARLKEKGYGAFSVGTRTLRAHRVAFELQVGHIPEGMLVLHECDVRSCVRGDHLFLGTTQDNTQDMINKGRPHGRPKIKGPVGTFRCSGPCKSFKQVSDFSKNRSTYTGLNSLCKKCSTERKRQPKERTKP